MGLISRRDALALGGAALAGAALPARAEAGALKLKRGVNAFPWFQITREYPAPSRDYPFPPFQSGRPVPRLDDLKRLSAAGLDFVRLPVDPGPYLAAAAPQRRALLQMLSEAVGQCHRADLNVVVNVQANGGTHYWTPARMTGATNAPEFVNYLALVGEIAGRLDPERSALEPINEPLGACAAPETRDVREALLARARAANARLTLVASGGCGSLIQGLAAFDPATLAKFAPVLPTFHFYEPYLFSHQGAPWMGERLYHTLAEVPWPAGRGSYDATMAATRARVAADATLDADGRAAVLAETEKVMRVYFDANPARPFIDSYLGHAAAWAKSHAVETSQMLLGEFGALRRDARYLGAHAEDRAAYVRDVRESAESFGFPWAFWCLFDGMAMMDDDTRALDPAIAAALGLKA